MREVDKETIYSDIGNVFPLKYLSTNYFGIVTDVDVICRNLYR